MAVTQTGSTQFFGLSGANPAAQSISVPSDAQLAVFWWSGWDPTNVARSGNITLGGVNLTIQFELAGNGTVNMIGVATLVNPPTGTQNLDWAFTADCDEGPIVAIEFYKGVDTATPVRDADGTAETAATATNTLTTQATDYVRLFTDSFGTGVANAAPGGSGQTQLATTDFNSESAAVGVEDTTGASSTTVTASGDFVSLASIAIIAGTATAVNPGATRFSPGRWTRPPHASKLQPPFFPPSGYRLSTQAVSTNVTGTLAALWADWAFSGAGVETFAGALSATFPDWVMSAAGAVTNPVTSTLAATWPDWIAAFVGTEAFSGVLAATIPDWTLAASGLETFAATMAASWPGWTFAGSGVETIPSTGAFVFPDWTMAASGNVGNIITGTLAAVWPDWTMYAVESVQSGKGARKRERIQHRLRILDGSG